MRMRSDLVDGIEEDVLIVAVLWLLVVCIDTDRGQSLEQDRRHDALLAPTHHHHVLVLPRVVVWLTIHQGSNRVCQAAIERVSEHIYIYIY